MFCKNCGSQMPDNSKFCNGCGTNLNGAAERESGKPAYKAPNFEFKTVRCYPSDSAESKYRDFYQSCGWQIMDMDRKQQYTGQSSDGTKHYSTQTHIKMQRDKNHPHYEKIRELSAKAEAYFDTTSKAKSVGKGNKYAFIGLLVVGIILGIFLHYILNFEYMISPNKASRTSFNPLGIILGAACVVLAIIVKVGPAKKIAAEKARIEASYQKNKAEAEKARLECKKLVEDIR